MFGFCVLPQAIIFYNYIAQLVTFFAAVGHFVERESCRCIGRHCSQGEGLLDWEKNMCEA